MTEFKDVLSTKRYSSEYWQNRFGQFYLKHNNYDKAIKYFTAAHTKYQQTARVFNGLGQAYLASNDKKQAILNFKRAVELAKESADENLQLYLNQQKKEYYTQ